MNGKIIYLIVSTEDDIHLVKGGIGTYLGLLVQAFMKHRPDINVIWVTEAPNDCFFVEHRSNCRVFYLPKNNLQRKILRLCQRICKFADRNKLFIEAPDWEGLLADLYVQNLGQNVTKITRLHSVLALTKQNCTDFSAQEKAQIKQERKQLLHTNIISAPTQYVYDFTCELFEEKLKNIPHFIIPNFINNTFESKNLLLREEACSVLNREIGKNIIYPFYKNIFVIGSMEYRKGTDIVIGVAKKMIDYDRHIHIYFLGHYEIDGNSLTLNDKYSLDELNGMISSDYSDNIHVCGYVAHDKLSRIYSACDTFLFAYRHDNFPGALIEACLSGKNIVYMPRGGCKEMMQIENKVLGLPFDGNNEEELTHNGFVAVMKSLQNIDGYTAEEIKNKYIEQDILQKMCCDYGIE